jgi:hypothetical protein
MTAEEAVRFALERVLERYAGQSPSIERDQRILHLHELLAKTEPRGRLQ